MFLENLKIEQKSNARKTSPLWLRVFAVSAVCAMTTMFVGTLSSGLALAQADSQFEIGISITGNDVTPPTVPANLAATAVSSSTISLSWDASVDNVGVDGYEVYRDTAFIATTTLLTYNDTGLTANTTYAYTVRAFDAALNFSAHSATATAQTLSGTSTPVVTPESGGGPLHPDSQDPVISDLLVSVSQTEARISWTTIPRTQGRLSWGLSSTYELGTLREIAYTNDHETKITDLLPGTLYHFELVVETGSGKTARIGDQTFRTLELPDTSAPANPSQFTAAAYGGENPRIDLSWRNPNDPDFADVRIVRSPYFPPVDIFDGKVVYEGSGETAQDTDVTPGQTYYYTIFARDNRGNFSSGAIAMATVPMPDGSVPQTPGGPFENLPDVESPFPEIQNLRLSDFEFLQGGKVLPQTGNRITVDAAKNLTIRLKYEKVPEVLKTIGITLIEPNGENNPNTAARTFSFLLRIDSDKEYYTATIAPLEREGEYAVRVAVIDFKNQSMKRLSGTLVAHLRAVAEGPRDRGFDITLPIVFLPLLLLLILLAFIFFILARRRRKEEEELQDGPKATHS